MQRRRQTKRLINGQNMSFARAMQNFVEFKFAFDKQQKKIYKIKDSESTVLVIVGG